MKLSLLVVAAASVATASSYGNNDYHSNVVVRQADYKSKGSSRGGQGGKQYPSKAVDGYDSNERKAYVSKGNKGGAYGGKEANAYYEEEVEIVYEVQGDDHEDGGDAKIVDETADIDIADVDKEQQVTGSAGRIGVAIAAVAVFLFI